MNDNDVICMCLSLTVADIRAAIQNGANTLEELQEETQAGEICGGCMEDLQQLIDENK